MWTVLSNSMYLPSCLLIYINQKLIIILYPISDVLKNISNKIELYLECLRWLERRFFTKHVYKKKSSILFSDLLVKYRP